MAVAKLSMTLSIAGGEVDKMPDMEGSDIAASARFAEDRMGLCLSVDREAVADVRKAAAGDEPSRFRAFDGPSWGDGIMRSAKVSQLAR